MAKTAADYRAEAEDYRRREEESFQRSDTDGFLSQWALSLSARKADLNASLIEAGGGTFVGLYEGERRVAAKIIDGQYGSQWLLAREETSIIGRRGKRYLPTGRKSRVLAALGLAERTELAPAAAAVLGSGTGLSGAANAYVGAVRTGDEWGRDARPMGA